MRSYILRFDIWVCLLVGFLASLGVEKIATNALQGQYEQHKAEHAVSSGEIGGPASLEAFRAQNIEDLLNHDTFTVISPGIEYRNRGAGYYNGMYLHALTLPSGEIVAARINTDAVTKADGSGDVFGGESILPLGQIVEANLEDSETFLSQIEFKEPLDRHDFYVDMVGNAAIASKESFIEAPVLFLQIATIFAVFALAHYLGSKIGIFPTFYIRKKSATENKSDWD